MGLRMKCNFVLALLLALLFGISPAAAQEPQPGDACPAENRFMRVAGPENPGSGHFLYCDSGLTWQPVMRFLPNGDVLFNSAGTPAAPLHVWGEAIIGNQGLACAAAQEGALRYTSSSDTWEFCDGTAWSSFGAGGTFTGLSDTPSAYTGAAGQFVRVNSAPDGVAFGPIGLLDLPAIALNNLSDVTSAGDPDGTVLNSFSAPGSSPTGLAWDGTHLWNVDNNNDTIYKLNPVDGSVLDSIPAPGLSQPHGLAWDGTHLWHADSGTNTIYKLDPSDGTVLVSFASPGGDPKGLTWDGTNLWNADSGTDTIYKLNPSDGTVLSSFPSPGNTPEGLAWDGTYLWNVERKLSVDNIIYKLDPADGSVLDSFVSPDINAHGLTWDGANLWNSDGTIPERIYKIGGSGPTGGDVLTYNSSSGRWENQPPAGAALADLTDVDTTGVGTGDFLYYDGANWVDRTLALGDLPAISLDNLSDVSAASPGTGEVLTWNGSNWTAQAAGGTPAGNDTEIQFNSGGSFGASPDLTWDGSALSVNSRIRIGGTSGLPAPAMP